MPHSYHSHSGQFCMHAKGTLEEVVLSAIAQKFLSFGLSEHMPRSRAQDLYPEEVEKHLTPEDLHRIFKDYVKEARRLQAKYAPQLPVLVGMETEYITPESLAEAAALRREHDLDYLVGSVHHLLQIPIDFSEELYAKAEAAAGGTEALFALYFDAQLEMLQALQPEVVGHFDLIRMYRPTHPPSASVVEKIERNVAYIVSYGGLIEINSRALKKQLKHPYPQEDILKIPFFSLPRMTSDRAALNEHLLRLSLALLGAASQAALQLCLAAGARFTLSDDSHGPADVGMFYAQAAAYLRRHCIDRVYLLRRAAGEARARAVADELVNEAFEQRGYKS